MTVWQLWLIAAAILVLVEFFLPGFFIATFVLGCLFSALASFFGGGYIIQTIAFIVGSLISFVGIRPLVLKHLYNNESGTETNIDALVGRSAVVIEPVDKINGRVKVGGEDWKASTETDETFESGVTVTVVRIDGATLIVKS
jgi:membrane protein implicated in regulation of membrane protease activity